ncbi:hypothetical protein DPQ33_10655 [Oceanidesulfovibrio indonesiensis]|uniref:Uncharacterized protein n=1 Tax=Oceanidesulfovibrio indonesiensis TaxID=54767 RepID=A0A7M3MDS2_9BACT|nr:hypothetical protein DPQ33_10655 [Oceanidesulfovibrio indonesiensis]
MERGIGAKKFREAKVQIISSLSQMPQRGPLLSREYDSEAESSVACVAFPEQTVLFQLLMAKKEGDIFKHPRECNVI